MSCEGDWTLKIRDTSGAEVLHIRPTTMNLELNRNKYDYCRMQFPKAVGKEMQPHTRFVDGALHDLLPADVLVDGERVKRLMFTPDAADYTNDETYIKLLDLHKALSDGTVNIQRDNIQLREIYEDVINQANNRLIDTVRFTVPESKVRNLFSFGDFLDNSNSTEPAGSFEEVKEGIKDDLNPFDDSKILTAIFDNPDSAANIWDRVLDGAHAVDYQNVTPLEAVQDLNEKFGVKSWIDGDSTLVVGIPEAKPIVHYAAPDDDRAWRYKNPNISHSREPIKKVVVEGAWVDEPGLGGSADQIQEVASWFDKSDTGGAAEARAIGVAERTDIPNGREILVKSSDAKKDNIREVAYLILREEIKKQNSGSTDIDPNLSGSEFSSVQNLYPGHRIRMVPEDVHFDNPDETSGEYNQQIPDLDDHCNSFVYNERYLVTSVTHNLTKGGDWTINADLAMDELFEPDEIELGFGYAYPGEEELRQELGTEIDLLTKGMYDIK